MCKYMHSCSRKPNKKWFICFMCTCYKIFCSSKNLFIYSLHSFLCQRTGIFYLAIRKRVNHTTRRDLFSHFSFWIIRQFRLFLDIEMIKISIKFIKSMIGWQHFISVSKVIFPKLTGHIPQRLKQFCDRRVFFL